MIFISKYIQKVVHWIHIFLVEKEKMDKCEWHATNSRKKHWVLTVHNELSLAAPTKR